MLQDILIPLIAGILVKISLRLWFGEGKKTVKARSALGERK